MAASPRPRLPERWRRLPLAARLAAVAGALLLLYLPLVGLIEQREEARLARLSDSAPARFLDLERSRHGMGAYLEALAELRDYDHWREAAPVFLIGAWAIPEPEPDAAGDGVDDPRDDPGAHCLSGIVIEDGRVRYFGARSGEAAARYRIDHGEVQIGLAGGEVLHVTVPRHLAAERRIDLALPGRDGRVQAWRCL